MPSSSGAPAPHADGDITQWLVAARGGDAHAIDRVVVALYGDLRRMAAARLRREAGGAPINPTELVHETYMRLGRDIAADGRGHFLALAARAMRQVLVDEARRRQAAKRIAPALQVTLPPDVPDARLDAVELLALDAALERLPPRQRALVECRFFGGLTDAELMAHFHVTDRTLRREWQRARARLYAELYPSEREPEGHPAP